MPGGPSHLRLSRRRAVQTLTALAASALVPLGSIARAQTSGEAQPGTGAQPGGQTPGRNNRFSPAPPASPAPPGSGTPGSGTPGSGTPGSGGQAGGGQPGGTQSADGAQPAPSVQASAETWVQNHRETDLWSGPDDKAITFGTIAPFSYLRVLAPQDGSRVKVQNPLTNGVAFVAARDVGPSGAPPEWYLSQKSQTVVPARIIGGANIRSTPAVIDGNVVGRAGHNDGVGILGKVTGSDGEPWYRVGPNEFIHGSLVRVPTDFPPHPGNLIVAELTDPCIVTAYENAKPVYSALALKGTTGWGTPTGFFTILRRVANETMSSETLGIPRTAPGGYYLKDVLYTQYFTEDGASIHYNYWSSNWGYAGSHGCLGMSYDDASWFWNWADVGTPLVIQE